MQKYCKMYGFENYKVIPYPNHFWKKMMLLSFGESDFEILFTPGMPLGISAFIIKNNILYFWGVIISQNSIGRIDLPEAITKH